MSARTKTEKAGTKYPVPAALPHVVQCAAHPSAIGINRLTSIPRNSCFIRKAIARPSVSRARRIEEGGRGRCCDWRLGLVQLQLQVTVLVVAQEIRDVPGKFSSTSIQVPK